jgi:glutathione S-transferase
MKMPDPARRDRQRALIEKGIETPFFRDHIKVFEKTVAEMEAQLGKTTWLVSETYTLADAEITPYIERSDRLRAFWPLGKPAARRGLAWQAIIWPKASSLTYGRRAAFISSAKRLLQQNRQAAMAHDTK